MENERICILRDWNVWLSLQSTDHPLVTDFLSILKERPISSVTYPIVYFDMLSRERYNMFYLCYTDE